MRVLGIDASRIGWVGVELSDGGFARARLAATLALLLETDERKTDEPDVVGIDIPLGFAVEGWREADALAARRLGARAASVFRVPRRAVWDEPDYATANRRCRDLTGAGLSVQSFGLRRRVLEANALRDAGRLLVEIHPELSFATMNGGPLAHPKKSWAGQVQRRALLAHAGIQIPDDLGPAGAAAPDDVLDAAAVAWSAARLARGEAVCLPDPPQRDAHGRPVGIWF
jgi:predicted RNase H-like nuclease